MLGAERAVDCAGHSASAERGVPSCPRDVADADCCGRLSLSGSVAEIKQFMLWLSSCSWRGIILAHEIPSGVSQLPSRRNTASLDDAMFERTVEGRKLWRPLEDSCIYRQESASWRRLLLVLKR